MPIVGNDLFAVGFMLTSLPFMIYLLYAYPQYAPSAIGACTVFELVCAAILPLFANPLYDWLRYIGETLY